MEELENVPKELKGTASL
jgi:hypothetical protein